ncbi:hypothetical protein Q3G72_026447 [Acer saccharum]|nr:hypothetical protein Q3G72_026447 [Acer saccharum]
MWDSVDDTLQAVDTTDKCSEYENIEAEPSKMAAAVNTEHIVHHTHSAICALRLARCELGPFKRQTPSVCEVRLIRRRRFETLFEVFGEFLSRSDGCRHAVF